MVKFWNCLSLKARLALVMLSTGILLVSGVLAGVLIVVSRVHIPSLEQQQQTLLDTLARGVDSQLATALQALQGVAQVTPALSMKDSAAAGRFLDNRTGIQSIFDNGLALFDKNGLLMAETPHNPGRADRNFADYPFFRQAAKANKPIISTPFRSTKTTRHPVVQFCTPVFSSNGSVIGYLTGGLRLDGRNFLGNLGGHRLSKSGYLYLYSHDRTMLVHPDRDRLIKQDVPPGVNRLFDLAITGWNGSGITTNSRGVKQIASFKSLSQAPWILSATIPYNEVVAPIHTATIFLLSLISILGIASSVTGWLLIQRMTSPLADFAKHLQNLPRLTGQARFLKPSGDPELKTLATSFNQMISELDLHMETIAQQIEVLDSISAEQRKTVLFLRLITDNVPDLIWAKDLQHRYIFTNKANNETLLFPLTPDEPLGKTHDYFSCAEIASHPDDPTWYCFSELYVASDAVTLDCRQEMHFQETAYVHGEQISLDVYKAPFYDDAGNLVGTIGSARNITREKQLEQENEKARAQAQLAADVFEQSSEGIVITDNEEKILLVNRAFSNVTGYRAEEVLGQTPRLLKSNRHDDAFYQEMWRCLLGNGRWQGELWNRRKNGEIYPEMATISVVRDGVGEITNYLAVFSDISGIKESQQRLDYLSWHDPLTDLPNRQMFNSYLTQAIPRAHRGRHQLALLSIDLDYFKDVNDSFGILTGDSLLKLVAQRLKDRMRANDFIARSGGDEFIILLEDIEDPSIIALVAEDIMNHLRQPFELEPGLELQTDLSIGISLFPNHGQTTMELLQKANAALFKAKQQGRAGFAFYSDELNARALERIKLGSRLRRALELDELRVVYQPQVDLSSGKIVGAEALMRWENRELGLISPACFIRLAEEIGCISAMGEWILRQVCLQGKKWLDEGLPPIILAVNLSPVQLKQASIHKMVADILLETGYPPELLELELTESALMEQGEQTVALLRDLRNLGVQLALDDFGTGYSSLAYLKYFPLHLLKIDKSFVKDIPHGLKDMQLVSTIVFMARSMGFKVLAEGVELPEQLDSLKTLNCDLYQGYLKSKPLPADEFIQFVMENA